MENTLAAQYLRVSTERQEYSLSFQSAGIATYAQEHNFTVCETYIDEAKSGLEIRNRKGLSQLLHDVFAGKHLYRAILVYDAGEDFKTRMRLQPMNFFAERLGSGFTIAPSNSAMMDISRTSSLKP